METLSIADHAETRLYASCRMALAGLVHDLGKFAERAGLAVDTATLEKNVHQYSPYHQTHAKDRGWFSHRHAAYTALAFDQIEAWLPKDRGDVEIAPFGGVVDDSLINAASRHHRPETFLQWVIATADRVASGFERSEFEKARYGFWTVEHGSPRPGLMGTLNGF